MEDTLDPHLPQPHQTLTHAHARVSRVSLPFLRGVRGVPRMRSLDRFSQYGIKVSFWGSKTLKIVIYVENYPQKRCFRLADYHPLWGGGVN